MAREATSAHLDSMIHYYKTGPLQGTTARLYVTPWDRNTVADGYWQTVNTIQPLINRDIYLADAIDKLAEKHTVYNEGYGIDISNEADGTHYISVDPTVDFINVPSYNFDNRYFTTAAFGDTCTVGLKIDGNYITASDNGINCNIDELLYSTQNITSYSAITANKISALTYTYTTTSGDYVVSDSLTSSPSENTVYIIG